MSVRSFCSASWLTALTLACASCVATSPPGLQPSASPRLDPAHPEGSALSAADAQMAREVELACQSYAAARDARIEHHNDGVRARVPHLAQIPDLTTYFRERIRELNARDGMDTPPGPELTIIDAAMNNLGFIDCSKPRIASFESVNGYPTVESAEILVIAGCGFGARQGRVHLVVNTFGGFYDLEIQGWFDNLIVAQMPTIEGVLDSDWNLEIVDGSGPWWLPVARGGAERSPLQPVKYRAKRELRGVFGAYMNGSSVEIDGESANDEIGAPVLECIRNDALSPTGTFEVAWSCFGDHFGVSAGTDTWSLELENGWVVSSLSMFRRVLWGDASWIADPDPPAIPGATTFATTVQWNAGGDAGYDGSARRRPSISYWLLLLVEGPIGTPYATTLAPKWLGLPAWLRDGLPCTPQ